MERFAGRVAVVTGAAMGIGLACATRLAEEGAHVILTDRDSEALALATETIRDRGLLAEGVVCDVAEDESVARLANHIAAGIGTVDVLVSNAGIALGGSVTETSAETWKRVHDVNLRGVWLVAKALIPLMPEEGGAIVNMASCQATVGFGGWAAYAASKGGVVSLTQQMAVDYAPRIRVNSVAPGTILTPLNEKIFDEVDDVDALKESWGRSHALGRFGMPEEVAGVVAFLASHDASFVTGACVPVDGGMVILGPT